jgi:hypothetical protein
MTQPPTPSAHELRAALAFDVQRLRGAVLRLEAVDAALLRLRRNLEARSDALSGEATQPHRPELAGDGTVAVRYAQAQATAQLASRAKLGEVLGRRVGQLALIASMAVSRWVGALHRMAHQAHPDFVLKGHIDAGRVAHRMLATLRPKDQLKSGCGQLASAVVAAELVHPDNLPFVHEQIVEGLLRGRNARGIRGDADVIAAVSRALRAAAALLESMAETAEPAVSALTAEAERVEEAVAEALARGRGAS